MKKKLKFQDVGVALYVKLSMNNKSFSITYRVHDPSTQREGTIFLMLNSIDGVDVGGPLKWTLSYEPLIENHAIFIN